jgi:hypothetical protein
MSRSAFSIQSFDGEIGKFAGAVVKIQNKKMVSFAVPYGICH